MSKCERTAARGHQHGAVQGHAQRGSRKQIYAARGVRIHSSSSSESVTERRDKRAYDNASHSPLIRVASCESVESFDDYDNKSFRTGTEMCHRRSQSSFSMGSKRIGKFPPMEHKDGSVPRGGEYRKLTCERTTYSRLGRTQIEPVQLRDISKPRKPTKSMTMPEFNRYLSDKRKWEEITKINRSKLKVDCHLDPKIMDTSYRQRTKSRQRLYEHNKIARDNLRFLETLQKPKSQYERDSHLKDFKKNCASMVKLGRHTDSWQPVSGARIVRRRSTVDNLEPLEVGSLYISHNV